MFTGLKKQLELKDCLNKGIVPQDHDLVKLKIAINWVGINKVHTNALARCENAGGCDRSACRNIKRVLQRRRDGHGYLG